MVLDAILQISNDVLVRRLRETWLPLLARMSTDDADWPWEEKARDTCYATGVQHVMITHDGDVQGILVTSLPDVPPGLSVLEDLVYVEWVATAPWNRPQGAEGPRLKGIGRSLIAHAARRSRSVQRGGRLGLHSEPGAVSFYESIRLRRCGVDPDEGLEYFEGDALWADAFLAVR